MADLAIVSKFEWADDLESENVFKDAETGFDMAAGFTPGVKCPRCWKYSEEPAKDDLCPRCAAVLQGA